MHFPTTFKDWVSQSKWFDSLQRWGKQKANVLACSRTVRMIAMHSFQFTIELLFLVLLLMWFPCLLALLHVVPVKKDLPHFLRGQVKRKNDDTWQTLKYCVVLFMSFQPMLVCLQTSSMISLIHYDDRSFCPALYSVWGSLLSLNPSQTHQWVFILTYNWSVPFENTNI